LATHEIAEAERRLRDAVARYH